MLDGLTISEKASKKIVLAEATQVDATVVTAEMEIVITAENASEQTYAIALEEVLVESIAVKSAEDATTIATKGGTPK